MKYEAFTSVNQIKYLYKKESTIMTNNTIKSIDIVTVIKVAGAFIALLIGSGFATGQEAMQFFSAYGLMGVFGSAITLVLFVYLAHTFMKLGMETGIVKNEGVFKYYLGKWVGTGLSWYTIIFIIAVFAIMLSGAGATLNQSYGIPVFIGSGIMAALATGTILLGLNKLIDVVGILGPGIIILTIFVAIAAIFKNPTGIAEGDAVVGSLEMYRVSSSWWRSSILYVGVNVLGLASFIPSLGQLLKNKREVVSASVLGSVLFVGALVLVSLALLSNITTVNVAAIPILTLAASVSPICKTIFAAIIFLGIYTSSTSLLWTVVARFSEEKTNKYTVLTLLLGAAGYFGGNILPFAKLVNIIYPTVGYAGSLVLIGIIIKDVRVRFFNKK
jgi:uncharacterized membrane protein YkvI